MVYDPPRQTVDVNRIVIYSFVPILAIYAAWRIQKFWLLMIINVGLGFAIGIPAGAFAGLSGDPIGSVTIMVIGVAIQLAISILFVKHYARKYNEKVAIS